MMFMFCLFQMNSALEKLEQSVSEMTALYSGQEGTCISVVGKILPQFQYRCSSLSEIQNTLCFLILFIHRRQREILDYPL